MQTAYADYRTVYCRLRPFQTVPSTDLDRIKNQSHLDGTPHAFDRLVCACWQGARVDLVLQAQQPRLASHEYNQSQNQPLAYVPALDRLAYVPFSDLLLLGEDDRALFDALMICFYLA